MTSIDDDTYALLMKRVYDMAGTVRDIKVFLNNDRLKVKGFKQVSKVSMMTTYNSTSKCISKRQVKQQN